MRLSLQAGLIGLECSRSEGVCQQFQGAFEGNIIRLLILLWPTRLTIATSCLCRKGSIPTLLLAYDNVVSFELARGPLAHWDVCRNLIYAQAELPVLRTAPKKLAMQMPVAP